MDRLDHQVSVNMIYITFRTIIIPLRAIICELQPFTIESTPTVSSEEAKKILDQIKITKSDLTDTELEAGLDHIRSYVDIFSKADEDVGRTKNSAAPH